MKATEVAEELKRNLSSLGPKERSQAIAQVQRVIRAVLFDDSAEAPEVRCCPRCGSVRVVKKGFSKEREQRYLCKDCGRTFCARTERIGCRSRLPKEVWMRYAECFVGCRSLRACAEECGVSLKTAFTMRHRLIEAVSNYNRPFSVGDGVGCELDETYFPESFKGNHTKGDFALPRPSRHRAREVRKRGLSSEQICVMTGVSDAGDLFLTMSGRGMLSGARAMEVLRGRVNEGAVVATDKAGAYRRTLEELGVAAHEAYDSRDRSKGTINRINTVHSLLESFIGRFRGVSTKRLPSYLAWFAWTRYFATGVADQVTASTVARQMSEGLCRTRTAEMFNAEQPYMDYWESREAA